MSRPRNSRTPGPVVNGGLIDFETNGLTSAYAAEGAYYPCPQAINAPMLAYGGATMLAPMQQQPGMMLASMQQQHGATMLAPMQQPGAMMMAQYPGGVMMTPMQAQYPSSYGMLAAQPPAPKEEAAGLSSASNEVLTEKERIRQNVHRYISQRGLRHPESDDDEMSEALHGDAQARVEVARRRYVQAKLDRDQGSARLSSETRLDRDQGSARLSSETRLDRDQGSARLSSETRLDRMEAELGEARERWRQRSSALSSRAQADRAEDELHAARERWMRREALSQGAETTAGRIAKLNAEARLKAHGASSTLAAKPMSAQERVLSRRY